ncbi:MAG: RagB/SusD family nutrient uptake outer membrane protein [Gemmatimonadaceae bacterium]
MRPRLLSLLLPVAMAGCSSILDVTPKDTVPNATAIVDASGAHSALNGAYSGLQSLDYYGEAYVVFSEVLSDNARHSGTYTSYADADNHQVAADNSEVRGIWTAIYDDVNRTNEIIVKVPKITGMDTDDRNEVLGEAYFLRALNYHNLVRLWGGVPLRLAPVATVAEAASITRSTPADVYQQILSDLGQAETLIANTDQTNEASLGAAYALEARVRLYMQDWVGAEAAARKVEDMGYALAPNFADLFTPTGTATSEDIFRVLFTPAQYNELGYYYLTKNLGGRYEVAADSGAMVAFDPASNGVGSAYNPADVRGQYSIRLDGSRVYAAKYRTATGAEHVHAIRFAEVILTRAEALAQLNRLPEAVDEYNRTRARAGLAPDARTGRTQADVLASIYKERRLELAFEGDRWPDLVRRGVAASTLGIAVSQTLMPIPQGEIDTAPGLTQNPGY